MQIRLCGLRPCDQFRLENHLCLGRSPWISSTPHSMEIDLCGTTKTKQKVQQSAYSIKYLEITLLKNYWRRFIDPTETDIDIQRQHQIL